MTWSANTGGGWTHSGTDLEVWAFTTRMAASGSLVVQILDPALPVGIRIYGSPLLDTCYEVITDGGTGGNIIIRKITYGTAGSTLDTAAHGLLDLDTYVLDVRWVNGKISVYLNGSTTALVEYDASADAITGTFTTMGFASEEDGARVARATLYTLTTTFAQLADVAWWVAGGILYASDSGPSGGRTIGAFFDPAATVSGQQAEWRQTVTIVDGTHAVKFDAATMTAAAKTIAAGTMPGQSALNTPPGQTTARFVLSYNDRGAGLLQDQYAIFPAIGTDDDYDLTVDTIGKAFVWPSQVGEPLLGAFEATHTRLIMWGRRSTWALTGDPVIGADISRLSPTIGGSGPNSACMIREGTLFLHSDQGAMLIPPGGEPIPLSEGVLTDIINGPTVDTHYVSVVQDTKSFGIWIFLTPIDGTAGTHLFYDQRTGRFSQDAGGFWPIKFGSADVQPTCAMRYLGDVVFGTLDGRMMTFDKTVKGEDGGDDFSSKLMMQMVRPDEIGDYAVSLREIALIMGLDSDPTSLTLYGGETPERAFIDTSAWTLWQGTMSYTRNSFPVSVAAPAMVLRLSCTGAAFALEACQVEYGLEPIFIQPKKPALSGVPICAPPITTTPDAGETPGEGPGPGGVDPGTCTDCADWMAINATDTVGGELAYLLAGPSTMDACQGALPGALAILLAQNICALDADVTVYITQMIGHGTPADGVQLSSDFLALNPADYPPEDNKTWRVYFRCIDQP